MDREQAIEIIETHSDDISSSSLLGRALNMAIETLKEQLSKEGTTSDLISRTETVKQLRGVLDVTVPITDYDGGYVDGVEVGISTVSTMPTIQPQSTTGQLNDGTQSTAQSTNLIDRQQAIDALDCISGVEEVLRSLPTIQPEQMEGEWIPVQRCEGDTQPDLECPFCKHRIGWFDMGRYCAGCGAKLKGGAG